MSASGDNAENKRKLVFLFALIGVILIAFIAIVIIANFVGLPDGISIPIIGDKGQAATAHDLIYNNMTSENGVVLTSMMRSADLVTAASGGAKWTAANPGWYLSSARADYVDSQGLAQHWTLAFQADTSVLVAVINNGEVSSMNVQDLGQSPDAADATAADAGDVVEQYPEYNSTQATPIPAALAIFDTGKAMKLALQETGINLPQSTMPFAITYDNKDGQAVYTIDYTDPATPSRSFVVDLDAVTGHVLRSDRGVSK
jgi:hypothetical protein